mmetsp:Transcript_51331/g.119312  ORF Transcript_51331/g.119312 Transcript_51331/m.119312 type:complete len:232 (+) Transcript_51331:89-784(+)
MILDSLHPPRPSASLLTWIAQLRMQYCVPMVHSEGFITQMVDAEKAAEHQSHVCQWFCPQAAVVACWIEGALAHLHGCDTSAFEVVDPDGTVVGHAKEGQRGAAVSCQDESVWFPAKGEESEGLAARFHQQKLCRAPWVSKPLSTGLATMRQDSTLPRCEREQALCRWLRGVSPLWWLLRHRSMRQHTQHHAAVDIHHIEGSMAQWPYWYDESAVAVVWHHQIGAKGGPGG